MARFAATVRLDTAREALYLRHGGILPYVARRLVGAADVPELSRSTAAP